MNRFKYFIFFIGILSSCQKEIEAPSYLYIEEFDFITNSATQGTADHNFTDVWVYVDDNYYGAYEMPAKVAIPLTGDHRVRLLPGIRLNGNLQHSIPYAFTDGYSFLHNFQKLAVDTIEPTAEYQSHVVFDVIDGFEGRNLFTVDYDGDPETQIRHTPNELFEGQFAAEITLTEDHPSFIHIYELQHALPKTANPTIIELHYKADMGFAVGLVGYGPNGEQDLLINGFVNFKSNWNKIYFDFKDIIRQSSYNEFRLAISSLYDSRVAIDTQRVYIDNIKTTSLVNKQAIRWGKYSIQVG